MKHRRSFRILCQCDTNCVIHFTLDAHETRLVACLEFFVTDLLRGLVWNTDPRGLQEFPWRKKSINYLTLVATYRIASSSGGLVASASAAVANKAAEPNPAIQTNVAKPPRHWCEHHSWLPLITFWCTRMCPVGSYSVWSVLSEVLCIGDTIYKLTT